MREQRAQEDVRRCRKAVAEAEQAIRLCDVQLNLARDHKETLARWEQEADTAERGRFTDTVAARTQLLERRCTDLEKRRAEYEAVCEDARNDLAAAQRHWQQVRARADAVIALADTVRADERRRRELRSDRRIADELAAYMGGRT